MRCCRASLLVSLLALVVGSILPAQASAEQMVRYHGQHVTAEQAAQYQAKAAALRDKAVASPAWGTASTSLYTLGPCDASIRDTTLFWSASEVGGCARIQPIPPGPSETDTAFPVHLLTGVLITEITVNYYDSHTADEPSMGLWETDTTGTQTPIVGLTPDPFSGGNNSQTFVVDPPYQVDNAKTLVVLAILEAASNTEYEGVYSVVIRYQLQVSPAPGTATFNDVPTDHPFFRFVEALAASGITAGCGGGNFCPDNPLTRGQMAVFLSIALGLHFPN